MVNRVEPLPGVNVVIDGTQQGTVTNVDGVTTLPVPSAQATLIFSFVGYLSERADVSGRTAHQYSAHSRIAGTG